MGKVFKKFLLQGFVASVVLFACSIGANAKEITVSTYKDLDNALKEAQEEATVENPYIITLDTSITPTYTLRIYSNTTLICKEGVTIKQTAEDKNVLRLGDADDTAVKGYYYENITIDGGIWDAANGTATGMKFAHGKNITLKNMTLKNVTNAHLMEVAGVDGITLENVTMENMILADASKKRYEAIQLDVLVEAHFSGYSNYEDLPIKNVTVNNCKFKNVPRGIGGHTGILNNPITNVSITNCTFEKVKSCAMQLFNVENVTISGNTISGCPRGIAVLSAAFDNQDAYLASTLAKQSGIPSTTPVTYVEPKADQGIVITNNTITTLGTDPFATYESGAIWLNGKDLEESKVEVSDKADSLPKGDYYLSGITIANNTITSSGFGVKICDVRNTSIHDNTFVSTAKKPGDGMYTFSVRDDCKTTDIYSNKSEGFYIGAYVTQSDITSISNNTFESPSKYGVEVIFSTVDVISGNTITNPTINGIYLLTSATVNTITSNTITNAKKYGIGLETDCSSTTISENTVTKAGQNGINLARNCTADTVSKNTVSNAGKYGIALGFSSYVRYITSNTITKPATTGIFFLTKCTGQDIDSNKITSPGKYGICIEDSSVVTNITKNTVSSAGTKNSSGCGIFVFKKSKTNSIASNKISKAKKHGIGIDDNATVGKITKNTVTDSGANGISVRIAKATDVTSNTIKNSGKDGIFAEKSTIKNVNSNKVTNSKGNGINIYGKTTVTTFKKNTVTKAGKVGIAVDTDCKVKKKSGNKITKCKTKTYNF